MKKLMAIAMLPFLGACSRGPSQAELEQVVQGQYDAFNAESVSAGATSAASQFIVHSVRKVDCTPMAQADQYTCNVEVDLTTPMIGRDKSVRVVQIADKGSHWQVLNVF